MLCALLAFSELVAVVDDELFSDELFSDELFSDELFSDEPDILVLEVVFCWLLITG